MRNFNIKTIVVYLAVFVVIVAIGVTIINRLSAQESVVYPLPSEVIVAETPMVSQAEKTEAPVEPEPVNEEITDEPVIDWEEPPVTTVYNPDADLNSDGHVDKGEWEAWVEKNPADLNQDLYIEDWEREEFNKPTESASPSSTNSTQKPSKSTTGGATQTPPPSASPSSAPEGGDTRTEAQKKADADAVGSLEDLLTWGSDNGKTQEEIDQAIKNLHKPFDPVGS